MSDYNVFIDDTTSDTWTVVVRTGNTAPSDGSILTNGGTTTGNLHVALQKAVECIKNHISTNGHD